MEKDTKVKLQIVMSRKLKDKIDWLSTNYDKEIAGFIIGKIQGGSFRLEDLIVPHQEAGGGSVDIIGKNLVKMKIEHPEECERIIGEWHSHHSMGSFYSHTDDKEFIDVWMAPRKVGIFIVSSKGKHTIRVEIRDPFFISLETEDYELEEDKSISVELKKEIETKITLPKEYSNTYNTRDWNNRYMGGSVSKDIVIATEKLNKKDFDEEKTVRQHVGSMVVYMQHENSVLVRYLDVETCNFLETEFDLFETKFKELDGYFELYFIGIESKDCAIQLMKDIRECLKSIFLNQISEYGGIPGMEGYYD